MKYRFLLIISLFALGMNAQGPYAPAAGEPGSTAIHKDSTKIIGWATTCIVSRGYLNISDTTSGYASFGNDTIAIGYPENTTSVVSLGDGGSAILEFEYPIRNGVGPDFAVFENGYAVASAPYQYFLELAFVEVSSDGVHFVRFPAISATQDTIQVGGFDQLDPTYLYNLAGKYVVDYGTPFDLEDIIDSANIDVNEITHVKIIDVIGTIGEHASHDSQGNKVNDPWTTPFPTGGFDLNAIGVIHAADDQNIQRFSASKDVKIYPNPIRPGEDMYVKGLNEESSYQLIDMTGRIILSSERNNASNIIRIPLNLEPGLYSLTILDSKQKYSIKVLVID